MAAAATRPGARPDPVARGVELHARAQALRDAGDLAAARRSGAEALTLLRRALGPRHPDVANALLELAAIHREAGDLAPALRHARRAVAALVGVRAGLAGAQLRHGAELELGAGLLAAGRYRLAEAPFRRALAIAEKRLAPVDAVAAHNGLGMCGKFLGRYDEAAAHYARAIALARRARVPEAELASIFHNLGGLEHSRGRFARGVPFARKAVALREAALGAGHPTVAADQAALAALLEGAGRTDEAEALFRAALATFREHFGPNHLEVGFNLGNLAALAHRRGDFAEAARLYRRAARTQEVAAGPGHPFLALVLENFGTLRRDQGKRAEARALYLRAAAIYAKACGPRHPDTVGVRRKLAELG